MKDRWSGDVSTLPPVACQLTISPNKSPPVGAELGIVRFPAGWPLKIIEGEYFWPQQASLVADVQRQAPSAAGGP